MRLHLVAMVLLAGVAVPAAAQRDPVEQRINQLERDMRAVQRRVFPRGAVPEIEPEITPESQSPVRPGASGSAVGDLTARVDALEAQLAALTGQIEESAHRTRQIEEAMNRFVSDAGARLARLESTPAPAAAAVREPEVAAVREPEAAAAPSSGSTAADPAEAAYNAGYRLWEQRKYAEAQTALEAVAERWPRSRWASWARNLAGRAYLDDNKPRTAARIFLANYEADRQGERAADSLYFLGVTLVQLDRHAEACRVYDELQRVYPQMRDWIRQRLPAARTAARCTS